MAELIAKLSSNGPEERRRAAADIDAGTWNWTAADLALLETATRSTDEEVAVHAARLHRVINIRGELASGLAGQSDWNPITILSGSVEERDALLGRVFDLWQSGAVTDATWIAAGDLALIEDWIGEATGIRLIEFSQRQGNHQRSRDLVLRFCASEDLPTARRAVQAAASLSMQEALPSVLRLLDSGASPDDSGLFEFAADVFDAARDIRHLETLANSRTVAARTASARLIRRSLARHGLPILERLVLDPDPEVRNSAAAALCQIGDSRHLEAVLPEVLKGNLADDGLTLRRFEGAFEARVLQDAIRSEEGRVQRNAVECLIFARDRRALLEICLGSKEERIRIYASYVAGTAGEVWAAPRLMELFEAGSHGVRIASATGLARLRHPGTLAVLRKALQQSELERTLDLLRVAASLGDPEGVPEVVAGCGDLLRTEREELFLGVPSILTELGGVEALRFLRESRGRKTFEYLKRQALAQNGEPGDLVILNTPIPDMPPAEWLRYRRDLYEAMGMAMPDLLLFVSGQSRIVPAGGFSENARFLAADRCTPELLGWLWAATGEGGYIADGALTALTALGQTSRETQLRLLRHIRAADDPERTSAFLEALNRAHEPAAWAAWVEELPVDREIRTHLDFQALCAARGVTIPGETWRVFRGRIAKDHIISLRRAAWRSGRGSVGMFRGRVYQQATRAELLKEWSDRLSGK